MEEMNEGRGGDDYDGRWEDEVLVTSRKNEQKVGRRNEVSMACGRMCSEAALNVTIQVIIRFLELRMKSQYSRVFSFFGRPGGSFYNPLRHSQPRASHRRR